MEPDALGVGVVDTPQIARVLYLGLVDVIEVEPQMFWQATGDSEAPVRIDLDLFARLRAMPQHKLVHSVSLPVGNSRPHAMRALDMLAQSVKALGSPYASEHLSFDHYDADSCFTGFLLPPRQDETPSAFGRL